ncbi:DoxX family protein [Pedobacter jamesrossensis]|uniref:DoxX family protein n=1 Tax=Pedobacter jamesrossensis TaxID=1908238 RepID=A0ABV8NQG4_9SPHI
MGAILLLIPVREQVKEWAYAGFTITFVSAFIAHTVSADPIANRVGPVVFLFILALSYITYHKAKAIYKV